MLWDRLCVTSFLCAKLPVDASFTYRGCFAGFLLSNWVELVSIPSGGYQSLFSPQIRLPFGQHVALPLVPITLSFLNELSQCTSELSSLFPISCLWGVPSSGLQGSHPPTNPSISREPFLGLRTSPTLGGPQGARDFFFWVSATCVDSCAPDDLATLMVPACPPYQESFQIIQPRLPDWRLLTRSEKSGSDPFFVLLPYFCPIS